MRTPPAAGAAGDPSAPSGHHIGLYNVSDGWRRYPAAGIVWDGSREVLSAASPEPDPQGLLWIPPLSARWIV